MPRADIVADGSLIFFDSVGPNPRVVRMFAAEKNIPLELHEIDIVAGENRLEPYLAINPMGGTPALQLPCGTILAESLAICEWLEELSPNPPLLGRSPEERASVRMWGRRIDLGYVSPLVLGFRGAEGRTMFEPRMRVVGGDAATDLRAIAFDMLDWLDRHMGAPFVTGDAFTLPDILLYCFVDFARIFGMEPLVGRPGLERWLARVSARVSARA